MISYGMSANRDSYTPLTLLCAPHIVDPDKLVLYKREQIAVPPTLQDILRDYTKEIVRSQPDDLKAWSAEYFRAMNEVSASGDPTVSLAQLRDLKELFSKMSGEFINEDSIMSACDSVNITLRAAATILSFCEKNEEGTIPREEFLVLGCAFSGSDLSSVIQNIFQLFGDDGMMECAQVVRKFEALAKADEQITPIHLGRLREAIEKENILTADEFWKLVVSTGIH